MAIKICIYCRTPKVCDGPRNLKRTGLCGSDVCWVKAAMDLAVDGMLSADEADKLNKLLGG